MSDDDDAISKLEIRMLREEGNKALRVLQAAAAMDEAPASARDELVLVLENAIREFRGQTPQDSPDGTPSPEYMRQIKIFSQHAAAAAEFSNRFPGVKLSELIDRMIVVRPAD